MLNVFWFVQGYFNYTVMYYGGYSNETLVGLVEYNMQLAYFFTIAVYMVLCGIALIFRSVHWMYNNGTYRSQYFGFIVHFFPSVLQ